MPEPKRIANGHHPLADVEVIRIPEGQDREVLTLDLDHSHIRSRIRADRLGRKFTAIGKDDGDTIRLTDDMMIREDGAVVCNDEAGTLALLSKLLRLFPFWHAPAKEVFEELLVK
jgi:hypothetical protein